MMIFHRMEYHLEQELLVQDIFQMDFAGGQTAELNVIELYDVQHVLDIDVS